ncbi:Uncharacterized protein GBIM_04941, partial [Gryllus bimaculatus]
MNLNIVTGARGAPRRLARLKGGAKTSGPEFEFKLAGLVALRARRRGLRFELFSNAGAARPCDDLLLRLLGPRPALYFVQLKHSQGQQAVGTQALVAKSGDFSLSKYFEFFEKLRGLHAQRDALTSSDALWLTEGDLADARFLLFTTKAVQRTARGGAGAGAGAGGAADDLFLTGAGGSADVFCFDAADQQVWDLFSGNVNREEIYRNEFLPRLQVFHCQSHADDLDGLILAEIQLLFGGDLPAKRANTFLDDYLRFLKSWSQDDSQDYCLTEATPQLLMECALAAELRAAAAQAARGL